MLRNSNIPLILPKFKQTLYLFLNNWKFLIANTIILLVFNEKIYIKYHIC